MAIYDEPKGIKFIRENLIDPLYKYLSSLPLTTGMQKTANTALPMTYTPPTTSPTPTKEKSILPTLLFNQQPVELPSIFEAPAIPAPTLTVNKEGVLKKGTFTNEDLANLYQSSLDTGIPMPKEDYSKLINDYINQLTALPAPKINLDTMQDLFDTFSNLLKYKIQKNKLTSAIEALTKIPAAQYSQALAQQVVESINASNDPLVKEWFKFRFGGQ